MENLVRIIASLSCLNVALPDITTVKSASYCISFTEMVSPAPEGADGEQVTDNEDPA